MVRQHEHLHTTNLCNTVLCALSPELLTNELTAANINAFLSRINCVIDLSLATQHEAKRLDHHSNIDCQSKEMKREFILNLRMYAYCLRRVGLPTYPCYLL